jgi:hypothetical protein
MSIRALIPRLEGGSAKVDAVDEELQGFKRELDAPLAARNWVLVARQTIIRDARC